MRVFILSEGMLEERDIDNTLEAMQEIVGGYIEVVPLSDRLLVVCNEEGKLMGLPPVAITAINGKATDYLCGNCIICADSHTGEFKGLTKRDMKDFENMMDGFSIINDYPVPILSI